jgi:outer membrane immunogenic protein
MHIIEPAPVEPAFLQHNFHSLKIIRTMKHIAKLLITALFLFLYFPFLQAQVGVGVRGGINIATAELEEKINDDWETEMKDYIVGGISGLMLEFGLTERYALQAELYYVQKGYKTSLTVENVKRDFTTRLNYIELPILFKGKFGPGRFKFNAMLGPSFAYGFNGKFKTGSNEADIDFDKDNVNRWDIGALLSLGASMEAGPGDLFLDARLGWGFSNLDDSANSDNYNWHNRGYNIGIGYIMYLNK